jgi:hypothetical protein
MYKILNMCITYFKILNQINMPAVLREIVRGVTINYLYHYTEYIKVYS